VRGTSVRYIPRMARKDKKPHEGLLYRFSVIHRPLTFQSVITTTLREIFDDLGKDLAKRLSLQQDFIFCWNMKDSN